MFERLEELRRQGDLDGLDEHFTRLLLRLNGSSASPSQVSSLALSASLLSHLQGQGQICLDLAQYAGQEIYRPPAGDPIRAPALEAWLKDLRACPVVGEEGQFCPLVLDAQGRLYLHRYWEYESRIAQLLLRHACDVPEVPAAKHLHLELERLFPLSAERGAAGLRHAAALALSRRLCVISGGPGTGKTTAIVRVLALLLRLGRVTPERIALAAPTGRAAARMQRALIEARQTLQETGAACEAIPAQAQTLHRLLGVRSFRTSFRYHREHRLPLDVLVVDEASMIDISLMAALLDALPDTASLFLLGDPDQLAPVEAGGVFDELCPRQPGYSKKFRLYLHGLGITDLPTGPSTGAVLEDSVLSLQHNYRFAPESGIARLAHAVREGEVSTAIALLEDPPADDLQCFSPAASWEHEIGQVVIEGFRPYLEALQARESAQEILRRFQQFRLLAALRQGAFGVEGLNLRVRMLLQQQGLLQAQQPWYVGRPILILQNHYGLDLYNGDVGIALPGPPESGGKLQVVFESVGGDLRWMEPSRLPRHEDAFALTVHKSQGSEFDRVLLVLPPADHALLSRELIYTGLSRARRQLSLWGSLQLLGQALQRRERHLSGLGDRLRRAVSNPALG